MLDAAVITGVAIQTLTGLLVSTGFLLTLFVGFVVIAGFSKFRKRSRTSLVHRNLVDRMDGQGGSIEYLSPDAPRIVPSNVRIALCDGLSILRSPSYIASNILNNLPPSLY